MTAPILICIATERRSQFADEGDRSAAPGSSNLNQRSLDLYSSLQPSKREAYSWSPDPLHDEATVELYWSSPCPYSRMARICAIEAGLTNDIKLVRVEHHPLSKQDQVLAGLSPLSQAPVLRLTTRESFYDSRVICECLNEFGSGHLIPSDGPPRWLVLRRQAIGVALMEIVLSCRAEIRLDPELQRSFWLIASSGEFGTPSTTLIG